MKLGESLEIALAVEDLHTSLAFYKTLGFTQFDGPYEPPHPRILLTDGTVHLGLHHYEQPSPILMYFTNAFQDKVEQIAALEILPVDRIEADGRTVMLAFEDPNGQRIGLADLMGARIEMPSVEGKLPIGEFGEFSIPTDDRDSSLAFYRQLGFEGEVYDEPYPWALLKDGLITIGLHQTPEFRRSTITYFAKDMAERIRWVRAQGIEPYFSNEEDGVEFEGGIQSPDGQPFFLFRW